MSDELRDARHVLANDSSAVVPVLWRLIRHLEAQERQSQEQPVVALWECGCGEKNLLSLKQCQRCSRKRPPYGSYEPVFEPTPDQPEPWYERGFNPREQMEAVSDYTPTPVSEGEGECEHDWRLPVKSLQNGIDLLNDTELTHAEIPEGIWWCEKCGRLRRTWDQKTVMATPSRHPEQEGAGR